MKSDRRDMWLALALEAAALVADHEAALIADADNAKPSIDMRLSAMRGQTRGLSWNALPYQAWDAGKAFLWAASQFADEDATPAQRRERGAALVEAALQIETVLAQPILRPRADVDD